MSKYAVILKETYRKNVKSIGFLIMILSPLVIIGIILAIGYFAGNAASSEELPIAVVAEDPTLTDLLSQEETGISVSKEIQTETEAKEALKEEKIAGYLTVGSTGETINATFTHTDTGDAPDQEILRLLLTNYQMQIRGESLGLTPEEAVALTEPAQLTEKTVEVEDGDWIEENAEEDFDDFLRIGAAYFVSIGIFIFIMTYSAIIAEEIASEKGTRIMEVILSSVSSTTHFFGKLTGVLLVCLTQIVLYILVGIIAFTQLKKVQFVQELLGTLDLKAILASLLGYALVFFFLGIFLYIVMAAFFGSLVTKMEDVNKAVTPVVMLALGGFYGGMFAFASPDNPIVKVLSYIPLFTPFIMPFRIAADAVTNTGILMSIAGTALFTVIVTWFSLMLYRSNVLIYSDASVFKNIKRSWQILKSDRHAKSIN